MRIESEHELLVACGDNNGPCLMSHLVISELVRGKAIWYMLRVLPGFAGGASVVIS